MSEYIILDIGLFIIRWIDYKFNRNNSNFWFYISAIALMLLIGLRHYLVGPDMIGYTEAYMDWGSRYDEVLEKQWVLNVFIQTAKNILPHHPSYFVFSIMLVTTIPVLWGIKHYSKDKIGSLIALMTFEGTLVIYVVTIRQGLAISFMLIALYISVEQVKNWEAYSVGFATLSLFTHSSSFLITPLLFVLYLLNIRKSKYIYLLIILSVFLGESLSRFVGDLSFYLISLSDEMARLAAYEGTSYVEDGVTRFRVYIPMSVLACWVVYCSEERNLNIFEKILIAGVVIFNVSSGFAGHLTQRFVAPFYVIALIGAFPSMKQRWPLVTLLLMAYIVRSYNAVTNSDFMTYKFFWQYYNVQK